MGTILTRRRKDGQSSYTAVIRLKKAGKVIHSETETFGRKSLALEWMRRREVELDQHRARGTLHGAKTTLANLIKWYRETVGPTAKWGRTKAFDLIRLEGCDIARRVATELATADYISHVMARRNDGAGPATVGNDLVWIGQVLRSARAEFNLPLRLDLLADARHELRQRKVIRKSRWRDRRVTPAEDAALRDYFARRDRRAVIPMSDIYAFAVTTTRRQEEITEIRRSNFERPCAWLDDVKHPTMKEGNRKKFRMLPEAWDIIDRQPEVDGEDRVFPYNPKSIGEAFARACKALGIEKLTFHDLRHEATSRLFERGYAIQEVAQFSLHESWQTLKRYTHLRPEQLVDR
ncbi:tyrosine-type recombinase/integrase [Dyella terrae]|nr:tyrosine-type recombinase/integrase [Dyella terrae]